MIDREIRNLVVDKHVFWEVQRIIGQNSRIHRPSAFYDLFVRAFASHAVAGIRRQIRPQKDSISLRGLLSEIIKHPKKLSRSYFRFLYRKSGVEELADRDFEKLCGSDQNYIDPEKVKADLEDLRIAGEPVEKFADRRVAHRDARDILKLPKFKNVNDCIDVLDRLCVKYHLVFLGKVVIGGTMLGTFQYDWTAIFREPWLPRREKSIKSLQQTRGAGAYD